MDFLSVLAEGVAIPDGTRLEGKFTMSGSKMGTDLLLKEPDARILAVIDTIPITVYNDSISIADDFKMEHAARIYAKYDLSREAYEADVAINNLNLHRFLPQDSLFAVSARLGVKGEGLDFMSPEPPSMPRAALTVSITAIISCRASNSRPDSKNISSIQLY